MELVKRRGRTGRRWGRLRDAEGELQFRCIESNVKNKLKAHCTKFSNNSNSSNSIYSNNSKRGERKRCRSIEGMADDVSSSYPVTYCELFELSSSIFLYL